MKEVTNTYWVAEDGSRFSLREACEEYERNCNVKLDEKVPDLYVKELENVVPLAFTFKAHNRQLFSSDMFLHYQWFKLNNKKDYRRLREALGDNNGRLKSNLSEPKKYPDLLAVELTMPYQKMPAEHDYKYSGAYSYVGDERSKTEEYFNGENGVLSYL